MSASIFVPVLYAQSADFTLVEAACRGCDTRGVPVHMGSVYSTDSFYADQPRTYELLLGTGRWPSTWRPPRCIWWRPNTECVR